MLVCFLNNNNNNNNRYLSHVKQEHQASLLLLCSPLVGQSTQYIMIISQDPKLPWQLNMYPQNFGIFYVRRHRKRDLWSSKVKYLIFPDVFKL